jgi:hypothetical protein
LRTGKSTTQSRSQKSTAPHRCFSGTFGITEVFVIGGNFGKRKGREKKGLDWLKKNKKSKSTHTRSIFFYLKNLLLIAQNKQ